MTKILKIKLGIILLAFTISVFAASDVDHSVAPRSDSLFNITDTWTTSEGKPFHLADLNGNPAVIAMIYTSCQYACPLVVADMKKIERRLPPSRAGKVRFAVISFDPEHDTIEKLKDYAKEHGIDSPSWVIANGSTGAVRRLAVVLGLKYKKLKSGGFEHDTLISVLDSTGAIKYQQRKLGQSGEEAAHTIEAMPQ